MPVQEHHVTSTHDGWPLEVFLCARLANTPRPTIRRLLLCGSVLVNGEPGWLGRRVRSGELVSVDEGSSAGRESPSPSVRFLCRGEGFVVVDKPAGLCVVPERRPTGPCVLELLGTPQDGGEYLAVHRLDRDTSGVLVVATSREAHRDLSLQFQNREVRKEYLAVVCGELDDEQGRIELPIGHDPRVATRMKPDRKQGKLSVTRYEVVERFRDYTLVRAFPETGRTHQVRVHLAGIGHSLAVDPMYADRLEINLSDIKPGYRKKPARPERPLIGRLTLHAFRLTIRRPGSAEPVSVEAPMPGDLLLLLKMLRKYRPAARDR